MLKNFNLPGNSYNIATMEREILNLDITLGPLHYRLQAHDEWASTLLGRINDRVACRHFTGPAHRKLHIVRQLISSDAAAEFFAGDLPSELAACVQEDLPAHDWQVNGNDTTYLTWRHPDTHHAFWTESCKTLLPQPPFHLPLDLLLHDIVQLGGAIIHGGIAVYKNQGVILTAPPGGGKTTAFSTTPENWQLESDDAALVWPVAKDEFLVSPLPTWSVLLGVNPQFERIVKWQVGSSFPLAGVFFLDKASAIALTPQRPLDAVVPLYRALSEYPTVIMSRAPYRVAIFKAASALARTLPIWSLRLPREGNFWPLLEERLTHGTKTKTETNFFRYQGRSMWPTFQEGDLLRVQPVTLQTLHVGDCITYHSHDGEALITHRVIALHDGKIHTRGDAHPEPDDLIVNADQLVGRVTGRFRLGGLKSVRGGIAGRLWGGFYHYAGRLDPQRTGRGGRVARLVRNSLQWLAAGVYRQGTVQVFADIARENKSYWIIGKRPMASFDRKRGCWQVPWPQSLLIDPDRLPDTK